MSPELTLIHAACHRAIELGEKAPAAAARALLVTLDALDKIMRQAPIMGSVGDYRAGQLHAIEVEAQHAIFALQTICDQWPEPRK